MFNRARHFLLCQCLAPLWVLVFLVVASVAFRFGDNRAVQAPVAVERLAPEVVCSDETIPPELMPDLPEEPQEPCRKLASYTIRKGDTLGEISKRYGVSVGTLLAANNSLSPRHLKIGQLIQIPPSDGVMVKIRRGDNLWTICRRYRADLNAALAFNNVKDVRSIRPGDNLFLPGAKAPSSSQGRYLVAKGSSSGKSSSSRTAGLNFRYPLRGRLTSKYGWRRNPMGPSRRRQFHTGIDIAAPRGRTVTAAEAGEVLSACYSGGLGNTVVILHKSGYSTVYGHNSKLLVKPGQKVSRGQAIAKVGNTGRSTGPHVHFEIRKNGKHVDPLTMLD